MKEKAPVVFPDIMRISVSISSGNKESCFLVFIRGVGSLGPSVFLFFYWTEHTEGETLQRKILWYEILETFEYKKSKIIHLNLLVSRHSVQTSKLPSEGQFFGFFAASKHAFLLGSADVETTGRLEKQLAAANSKNKSNRKYLQIGETTQGRRAPYPPCRAQDQPHNRDVKLGYCYCKPSL